MNKAEMEELEEMELLGKLVGKEQLSLLDELISRVNKSQLDTLEFGNIKITKSKHYYLNDIISEPNKPADKKLEEMDEETLFYSSGRK